MNIFNKQVKSGNIVSDFRTIARKNGASEKCIEIAINNAVKSGLVTRSALVTYLKDAMLKNNGCEEKSFYGGLSSN